jgi:uncharacterized coiled-coil protein SlyX
MIDRQARKRIQALEERAVQRDREVAELSSTVSRLTATVEAIRVSSLLPPPSVPSNRPALVPSSSSTKPPNAPSAAALPAAPAGFVSRIAADFPALFAEFRWKRFKLLWRGSCYGFNAGSFHSCCDGRAPTLTLIQDTGGSIFGLFTPVAWESRDSSEESCFKGDPSLKSFVFTLKNPHNFPPRKFALKAERRHEAINCDSECGPDDRDIWISEDCNKSNDSYSYLGHAYANETGLDGKTVLTGSKFFRVKEIEVFGITG